ncbi:N-acetylmuramoyl-L-alanine amidase [Paenilisteria newyorkensis]|uniref:N-acetylmuramoyl-L-alanine amidase n=1 Tax=Listeria newyorkensis TaxID=1497681 RepID=UPI002359EADA|nr:N-acetylmuramoyl-L-alanine amidase [Listeria newyorkensis]WAO21742.1 N-acetylmuramoyl-L-alanine amidase [Listeria newyorkensis]
MGKTNIDGLVTGFQNGKINVNQFLTGLRELQKKGSKTNLSGEGKGNAQSFVDGANSKKGAANSAGRNIANSAKDGASAISAESLGRYFADGYARGISSAAHGAQVAASNMVNNALAAIKNTQVSKSPAKKTIEKGRDFSDGYAIGIDDNADGAIDNAANMALNAIDAVNGAPSMPVLQRMQELATNFNATQNYLQFQFNGMTIREEADINKIVDAVDETAQGTTGFYADGSATSKSLAQKVNDHVDDYFKDRDIKPDTSTRHGRLGILRETNAPAMLLETCFISNKADMTTYNEKKLLIAQAIVHGALEYFNIGLPQKAPAPDATNKGKQGVYAKMPLRIRTKSKWESPVAFTIPEAYYAELNWGVRENGWVRVEFQGKVGWLSAAVPVYWNLKNPNQRYKAIKDVLTRADAKWGGKPSFRLKKGEEVNVIGLEGTWLKCSKAGVIGYLPNDGKHLIKK